MDLYFMPPAYIREVQGPLSLYTNLNPADDWKKPMAPENPMASLLSAEQPQTVQNNMAMLTALSTVNWPIIRAALEMGTYATSEQAFRINAIDRSFADDATGQMKTARAYNERGEMVLIIGGLEGQISYLV